LAVSPPPAAPPRGGAPPPAHELDGEAAQLDQHDSQREHRQDEDGHAQGLGDLEDHLAFEVGGEHGN
jgi:hypothetical protein